MKKIIIAIDGLSSCGKSTMARQLAKHLGYIYVDTGAMYRAVTLFAIQNNLIYNKRINKEGLKKALPHISIQFQLCKNKGTPQTLLNKVNVEKEIRSMEVSNLVSQLATLNFVRDAMVKQQQEMGKNKGIVMDGRDIGSTVFPHAELKIFVQASAEIRAQRRFDELIEKGIKANYLEVLQNVKQRDEIDQNRAISPLRPAKDAHILDNSNLTIEEQNKWLLAKYNQVISSN